MTGHGWRDLDWEEEILKMTRELGIGAQFGGKYYCHDVRVIRLPRRSASFVYWDWWLPVQLTGKSGQKSQKKGFF